MGKLTKSELIKIATNYTLRYDRGSDIYHFLDIDTEDTRNRLITLICYLSGKQSIVKFFIGDDKKLGNKGREFFENLGTEKPLAKKLNSLMKIFNTYCELKPVTDKPNEKSEPRIKYYLVDGKIPKILGELIDNFYIRYKIEDEVIKDKIFKENNKLKDKTTEKLFNDLIKE